MEVYYGNGDDDKVDDNMMTVASCLGWVWGGGRLGEDIGGEEDDCDYYNSGVEDDDNDYDKMM